MLCFLYNSCIHFGHGWVASVLYLLRWTCLPMAFRWCCLCMYASRSNFSLSVCVKPQIFFQCFIFLFYSPFSSLSVCISQFLYSLLSNTPNPLPVHSLRPFPPRQTYPITRTITKKTKLWIKGMISPQWPMPWRGWVPLRRSPRCPAVLDPLPVCTTASCSAQAARKLSNAWRWTCFGTVYLYCLVILDIPLA